MKYIVRVVSADELEDCLNLYWNGLYKLHSFFSSKAQVNVETHIAVTIEWTVIFKEIGSGPK